MLPKMSLGSFVLIIYDPYSKCPEYGFVKIMKVLVMCKLVLSSWRCKNISAWCRFLDGNVALFFLGCHRISKYDGLAPQRELRGRLFASHINQGTSGLPVVTSPCVEGLWGQV